MQLGGLGRTRQSGKVRGAGSAVDSDQGTTEVQEKGAGIAAKKIQDAGGAQKQEQLESLEHRILELDYQIGDDDASSGTTTEYNDTEVAGFEKERADLLKQYKELNGDNEISADLQEVFDKVGGDDASVASDIDTSSIGEAKDSTSKAQAEAANAKKQLQSLLKGLESLTMRRFENDSVPSTPRNEDPASVQTSEQELKMEAEIDQLKHSISDSEGSVGKSSDSEARATHRGDAALGKEQLKRKEAKLEKLTKQERRQRTRETYNDASKSNVSKAGSTNSKESASQSDDLLSILESKIKSTHTEKKNKNTMKLRRAMRKARSVLKHEGKPNKKMLAFLQKQGVISPEQYDQFMKQI